MGIGLFNVNRSNAKRHVKRGHLVHHTLKTTLAIKIRRAKKAERAKECVRLRNAGFSVEEVMEIMNISKSSVYKYCTQAKKAAQKA